jgi:hypothetical protein
VHVSTDTSRKRFWKNRLRFAGAGDDLEERSMHHPVLRRQRTAITPTVDFERTLVHDDARGVYLLTARRQARQPSTEQIEVWKRWQALRQDPAPVVTELRETFTERLARIRRRRALRKAAAQAALAPRLDGLSS